MGYQKTLRAWNLIIMTNKIIIMTIMKIMQMDFIAFNNDNIIKEEYVLIYKF